MEKLKPLNLLQSIGYFGLSALMFRLCVYNLMPALLHQGLAPFWAFIVSYSLPLLVFIVTTFVLVAREGNLHQWAARLRLRPLTGKQWLYVVAIFVLSFLVAGLLFPTARFLAMQPAFAPPSFLPDLLNPAKTIPAGAFSSFMGVPLKGAYTLLFVYFIFLTVFNILGEELWFRGYILPRQQLV